MVLACAEKRVIPEPVSPEAQILKEAGMFWDRKNYRQSQNLYQTLSQKPGLTQDQQTLIWQRLGISAFYNKDFETAHQALEKWELLDPRAAQSWQWHEYYSISLKKAVGENEFHQYLEKLSRDQDRPFEIRANAALSLAFYHFEQERFPESMSVMERIFTDADTRPQKIRLENKLQDYLSDLPLQSLEKALPFVDHERQNQFPQNIFFWTLYSGQLKKDSSLWDSLWPKLSTLSRNGGFIDPDPFVTQVEKWLDEFGMPIPEIVLLLPLSGQFSSAGWKIMRGAGAAHWELLLDGVRVNVKTLNTDQDGWINELKKLDTVSVVGGPVSRSDWEKIVDSGLNKKKVFFSFLPSIDEEGSAGWRFFSSPADQVRSMLEQTVSYLGFTDFGVFYPEDDFGRAYAQVFWEEAARIGARISGLQSYPPDQPARWNDIVASFLKVKDKDDPTKNPPPDFQAVFIPDSLSRVKGMVPQFFYFDQNQLLFMGPMLWSQAFSPQDFEQQYFSLSMTPGAWWDDNPSSRVDNLKQGLADTLQGEPDFWVALGYDFVRFASQLGTLPSPSRHRQVNQKLSQINFNDWSMAPISWDGQGKARQDLYLFQMTRRGLEQADLDYFYSLIELRKARKAQWLEMLRDGGQKEKVNPEHSLQQ